MYDKGKDKALFLICKNNFVFCVAPVAKKKNPGNLTAAGGKMSTKIKPILYHSMSRSVYSPTVALQISMMASTCRLTSWLKPSVVIMKS